MSQRHLEPVPDVEPPIRCAAEDVTVEEAMERVAMLPGVVGLWPGREWKVSIYLEEIQR